MSAMIFRAIAALALLLMLAVYYADGLHYQVWADSRSYLQQGLALAGLGPFTDLGGRNFGYPLLIAAALHTPAPMLALVIVQLALATAAFVALWWSLAHCATADLPPRRIGEPLTAGAIGLLVALASLYSVVHIQAASILTETLFVTLMLAGLLATIAFLRVDAGARWVIAKAAGAALAASANLAVKPHGLLAALLMVLVVGWHFGRLLTPAGAARAITIARRVAALAFVVAIAFAVTIPDRILARLDPVSTTLFGPRTLMCNHVHLIDDALARRPTLRLQDDAAFEATLRAYFKDVRARHTGNWRRLGFNGDLCSYDSAFSRVLDAQFPDPKAQAAFLVGAWRKAALADPGPFARKIAFQVMLGVVTAFEKYAIFVGPGGGARAEILPRMPAGFERGIRHTDALVPLGSEARLRSTLAGKVLQGALSIFFFGLTGLLCCAVAGTPIMAAMRWRHWTAVRRRACLVHLGLPIAVLLAHHGLVAVVHTFDIWRYGFNMFLVNLYVIGAGGLLLASEPRQG